LEGTCWQQRKNEKIPPPQLWSKYGDFNPIFSPQNKATLGQAFPKKKKKKPFEQAFLPLSSCVQVLL